MAIRTAGEVFKDRLRVVRESKRWKQLQLAERVTELGAPMHQTAIAKIENGERKVTLDDAMRLAVALDVSPLSLLLPMDDSDNMSLAPNATPMPAKLVRAWIGGETPISAMPYQEGDEVEHRTLDGQVLDESEAMERRRFYGAQEPNDQWRVNQIPGLGAGRQRLRAVRGADVARRVAERGVPALVVVWSVPDRPAGVRARLRHPQRRRQRSGGIVNDAEMCRQNGWGPGTRIVGDEGYGPTVIEITAVGEEAILAKAISHDGKPLVRRENTWVLSCRDWQLA